MKDDTSWSWRSSVDAHVDTGHVTVTVTEKYKAPLRHWRDGPNTDRIESALLLARFLFGVVVLESLSSPSKTFAILVSVT
jgi:hypothetical protein